MSFALKHILSFLFCVCHIQEEKHFILFIQIPTPYPLNAFLQGSQHPVCTGAFLQGPRQLSAQEPSYRDPKTLSSQARPAETFTKRLQSGRD